MKFAIVGAGGVGGYFGGRLADSGHDVSLVARGSHLQALLADGLHIDSPEGNLHVTDINATDQPDNIGDVDAVIVAVKGWQLESVVPLIKPLIRPETAILPLLNGVEATQTLSKYINSSNVLNGLCGIIAHLDGPGRIKHVGIKPFIKLGESSNEKTDRVRRLQSALMDSGIDSDIPDDIDQAIWRKFIFIAPLSGVTAVTRSTMDTVRKVPETRNLLKLAIEEAIAVGTASGVAVGKPDIKKTFDVVDNTPSGSTTSMQRDIESGQPSELDTQTGAIVRLGKLHNIPTPINDFIYASLLPRELEAVCNAARTR